MAQRVASDADALDDAAPGPVGAEPVGEAEQLGHPVEHEGLDLGAGRARGPRHAVHPEAGRGQVTQDRRVAGVGGEVGEEAGVLPVGQAGDDDPIEVGEHRVEGLGLGRGVGGELVAHPAGLRRGGDGEPLDPLEVVGDPVDERVALLAEVLGGHAGERNERLAPSRRAVAAGRGTARPARSRRSVTKTRHGWRALCAARPGGAFATGEERAVGRTDTSGDGRPVDGPRPGQPDQPERALVGVGRRGVEREPAEVG